MTTRTETENIKTSGAEKALAVILAAFILIGAIWAYDRIGHIADGGTEYYDAYITAKHELPPESAAALKRFNQAKADLWQAQLTARKQRNDVEFDRETYRTEIDAGRPAPRELGTYRQSQANLASEESAIREARAEVLAAEPQAIAVKQELRSIQEEVRDQGKNDDEMIFALRLLLVAAMLGGGYAGLSAVRRRRSRLMPVALAEVGAATALALYMAGDYGSDLGVFEDVGPLAISLVGIAFTVGAFIALQRYLAKRVPIRRVRRRECPFCGYPNHGNSKCEGCGRRVIGECSTCHEPRRVATPHCGTCGAA